MGKSNKTKGNDLTRKRSYSAFQTLVILTAVVISASFVTAFLLINTYYPGGGINITLIIDAFDYLLK